MRLTDCVDEKGFNLVTDTKMTEAVLLRPCFVSQVFQAKNLHHRSGGSPTSFTVYCVRQDAIPKRGSFSRSPLERALKEPSYIEKTKKELSDYCTTLEGDQCYSCWETWLDLNELEREAPQREVESIIRAAGNLKSLIGYLHFSVELYRDLKKRGDSAKLSTAEKEARDLAKPVIAEKEPCPIPDGIPKSPEELQEEEEVRSQDSPFTRLLRAIGGYPSWYTPRPDHETD